MYTVMDVYAAKARVDEWQRQADVDRLVAEAMRANRTQVGNGRLINLFSQVLTFTGHVLLQTAERLEKRYHYQQPDLSCEEAL